MKCSKNSVIIQEELIKSRHNIHAMNGKQKIYEPVTYIYLCGLLVNEISNLHTAVIYAYISVLYRL